MSPYHMKDEEFQTGLRQEKIFDYLKSRPLYHFQAKELLNQISYFDNIQQVNAALRQLEKQKKIRKIQCLTNDMIPKKFNEWTVSGVGGEKTK